MLIEPPTSGALGPHRLTCIDEPAKHISNTCRLVLLYAERFSLAANTSSQCYNSLNSGKQVPEYPPSVEVTPSYCLHVGAYCFTHVPVT